MVRIEASIDAIIPVQDKVLVEPIEGAERLSSGLYLPPTVKESESLGVGKVVRVGPGFPIPLAVPWSQEESIYKYAYIPLQAKEGDLAVFYQKQGVEVHVDSRKYLILPHSAILLLVRVNNEVRSKA